MKYFYTEAFRGEELRRDEPPLRTHHWLSRRVELSQKAERRAYEAFDEAKRLGVGTKEQEALRHAYEESAALSRHAVVMRDEFAKRWKPGIGYLDPKDWESNQVKPEPRVSGPATPTQRHDNAHDEAPIADLPDEPRAGARILLGEEETSEALMPRAMQGRRTMLGGEPADPLPRIDANEALPADRGGQAATCREAEPLRVALPAPTGRIGKPSVPASRSDEPTHLPEQRVTETGGRADESVAAGDAPRRSYKGLRNTPPDEHKFRKGKPSPNPKGRPRGTKNLKSAVAEVFAQTIKIKDARGRKRTISVVSAALHALRQKALGGDLKAWAVLLPLLREHWNDELPPAMNALSEEERAILKNSLALQRLLGDSDDEEES